MFLKLTKKKIVIIIVVLALLLSGGTTGIVLGVKNSKNKLKEITSAMYQAPTAKTELKYNLGKQEIINPGQTEYGTFMYKLGEEDWNLTTPLGEFGSYEVLWYIDAIEGYKDLGSKEEPYSINVEIAKGTYDESKVIKPKAINNLVYTGEPQDLVEEGYVPEGSVMYSLDGINYSDKVIKVTNAGDYVVNWYVEGSDKINSYGSNNEPFQIEVSVAKAEIKATDFVAPTIDEESSSELALIPGKTECGTFMYAVDNGKFSEEIPNKFEEYHDVYWYIEGNENYESYNYDSPEKISFDNLKLKIYEEDIYFPSPYYTNSNVDFFPMNEGGVYGYGYDGVQMYYSWDKQNWSTTPETKSGLESGRYVAYWYIDGGDSFYSYGSRENPFGVEGMISERILTFGMDFIPPFGEENGIYTGEPVSLLCSEPIFDDSIKDGEAGDVYYSLDGINYSTNLPTAVDIGEYKVYWYLTDGTLYSGIGSMEYPMTEYAEIRRYNIREDEMTFPEGFENLYFTGEEQELVNQGYCTLWGTEFMYSLDKISYSNQIPIATNAGSYTVYWYASLDGVTEDYGTKAEPFEINVTISEKMIEIGTDYISPVPHFEELVYDGTEKELLVPANTSDDPTIQFTPTKGVGNTYYSLDKINWSTTVPTALEIGDYIVYWYCEQTATFDGIGSREWPLMMYSSITFAYPEQEENLVADGSEQTLIKAGECGNYGTFYYRVRGQESYSTNLPKAVIEQDTEKLCVEFYIKGNRNYSDIGTAEYPYSLWVYID